MKISAVQGNTYCIINPQLCGFGVHARPNYDSTNFHPKDINFKGIPNAGPIKRLCEHDLPCMYRNVITIGPKHANKTIRSGIFSKMSCISVKILQTYENKLCDVEKRVYRILVAYSQKYPKKDIQEILEILAPKYEKRLREKQKPIFKELDILAENLSPESKVKYDEFMVQTHKKLKNEPIIKPFNKESFLYKLQKIKGDVGNIKNPKTVKVVEKLILEAEKMPEINNPENSVIQNEKMAFLYKILSKSLLKKYEPLNNLFDTVSARINNEPILYPFSRKAFIYELSEIFKDYPNEALKNQMISKARSLPTSRNSIAAYIVKFNKEPSDKIAYRLLCPTFASIEHILPQANGGPNTFANFGVATVRENSDRGNIDFIEQIKRRPGTKKYSQRLINRLIELYKNGTFDKCKVPVDYIEGIKKTIFEQSNGQINLSTRKLYK